MEVPRDDVAEETVAGCCVDSHHAYKLATTRLAPEHFYRPDLRRIVETCATLGDLDGPSLDVLERRIAAIAAGARLPSDSVRQLVDDRPVQTDVSGSYAARVLKAHHARHLMTLAADIYNQLGSGQPLDIALTQAAETARYMAGDAA